MYLEMMYKYIGVCTWDFGPSFFRRLGKFSNAAKITSLWSYKIARTKVSYLLFVFSQRLRGSGGSVYAFECRIQYLIVDWFVQNVTRLQLKLKILDKAPPAIVKVIIYSYRISFYKYNWITVVIIIVHKCELLTRNLWVDFLVGFLVVWFFHYDKYLKLNVNELLLL